MYCSTELPKVDEAAGEEEAVKGERIEQALDPALLASLPPGLRAQFGAVSAKKGSTPPPATPATPPPAPAVKPAETEVKVEAPAALLDDLNTITGELQPMGDTVSYDETLGDMAVESLIAEIEADDPTSMPEPVLLEEPVDLEPLPVSSIQEQYVPSPDRPLAVLQGRGPWGPRSAEARLLLLPDPTYQQRLPWLRARLHNLLGLDAYTANLYLQRAFPVYLEHFDSREEADELAAELDRGGMGVMVLTRSMIQAHPQAVSVRAAAIEGDLVVFGVEDEDAPLVTVPQGDIEAAFTGEIKPMEAPDQPLVERSFWRNKPRPSLTFDEVGNPYWVLDLVSPRVIVRVRSDRFDFSVLGDDKGPSSLFNLRSLPAVLTGREFAADDLFKRVPRVKRERNPEADVNPDQPPEEVVLFDEYVMIQTVARRYLTQRGG